MTDSVPPARIVIAALLLCAAASAQPPTQPPVTSAPALLLQPQMQALRPFYLPEAPVWIRFSLLNGSDQPLDLPYDGPSPDGVVLPTRLVLGPPDTHLLTVSFEREPAKGVVAPSVSSPLANTLDPRPAPQQHVLRLAPRAMIGAELDLREFFPAVRYTGHYRLEWRPLGDHGPVAATEFRVEARRDVIMILDLPQKITFKLDYDGAPLNVQNFVELVESGFYDGTTFHRVIPNFLMQGGRPKGTELAIRSDGKLVPGEFRDVPVEPGTLLMARKPADPNSASCQFFVALARLPEVDRKFTVIGRTANSDSLTALQQLALATPTDKAGRPISPLVIRAMSVVAPDEPLTRTLDTRVPTTQPAPRITLPTSQPAPPMASDPPQTVSDRPADWE